MNDKRVLLAFILSLETRQPIDQPGTGEIPVAATENLPADSAGSGAAAASESSSAAPRRASGAAASAVGE